MSQHAPPDADAKPKLRPYLEAGPHGENMFVLHDPRMVGRPVVVSPLALALAEQFDGEQTLAEIRAKMTRKFPGLTIPLNALVGLAEALDDALLLDSPRLCELFEAPVRKPTCLGSYSADPGQLREQLTKLFTADGGPGLPGEPRSTSEKLRAVLVPHMDYGRGNITYGHGFAELVRNTAATTFVIVATSHYSPHRFTLTRQHFDTPLGLVETYRDYVDAVGAAYGDGLFDDPVAHVPEHSIELEVVLLKFLLGDRPFRIVPLLVGSFRDCVNQKASPETAEDVGRMVAALRSAEKASSDEVCYLISGDLAHIGPKFKDRRKAAGPWLDESRAKDTEILKTLEAADPAAYFDSIAAEGDARRICGLSPTWLTLAAVKPRAGKVLHYQQYVEPNGHESVSFAAAAFYE
jgi:AmmeMemoRadiSam system protein B